MGNLWKPSLNNVENMVKIWLKTLKEITVPLAYIDKYHNRFVMLGHILLLITHFLTSRPSYPSYIDLIFLLHLSLLRIKRFKLNLKPSGHRQLTWTSILVSQPEFSDIIYN